MKVRLFVYNHNFQVITPQKSITLTMPMTILQTKMKTKVNTNIQRRRLVKWRSTLVAMMVFKAMVNKFHEKHFYLMRYSQSRSSLSNK
jgi:hypothetical protein